MCIENINEILNIDFSAVNDEFNWLNNTPTAIETIGGQLRLVPQDAQTEFIRGLGAIDPTNNRIRLQVDMEVFRTQTSQNSTFGIVFGVYNGLTKIDEFTAGFAGMTAGQKVKYNFDRNYKYEGIAGNISVKITFTDGFQNQLFLNYIKCWDFNFCQDKVRTYFLIDSLLEESFDSVSSGFQLLEWKIDDVETLTASFFTENPNPGSNPMDEWKFARANQDGSERVSDETTPNTFNPFVKELGLLFENVDPYFGGKPTGTISGSNYGTGILTLGFEKPEIINGDLLGKKGAFFIDLDYTKNLKVVFNVIVNNVNSSVFVSPAKYRRYTIIWDCVNCKKYFYYQDQLLNPATIIPVTNDGFLFGLTPGSSTQVAVSCSDTFTYSGEAGVFEYQIEFGTAIGQAGIKYNAGTIPDKFEIEWNGENYNAGFRGQSIPYDTQLINAGVLPSDIKTSNPSNGNGFLYFNKTSAVPTTAIIRVTGVLGGTGWVVNGVCPGSSVAIKLATGGCGATNFIINAFIPSVGLDYIPTAGDFVFSNALMTLPYTTSGNYKMAFPKGNNLLQVVGYSFDISVTGEISNVIEC